MTPGASTRRPTASNDVYVTKVDAGGASLAYSTLLGGGGLDDAGGLAVDAIGQAYVSGGTANATVDHPTTVGAYDADHQRHQ